MGQFKVSSPIAQGIWYTLSTEREAMRKTDAVEISADNPTVCPVTLCFSGKRTKDVQAAPNEPPDFSIFFIQIDNHRLLSVQAVKKSGIVNILNFLVFAKVGQDVADKGNQEKNSISQNDQINGDLVQIWEKYEGNQTDKHYSGANFSSHQGAGESLSFANVKNCYKQLEKFFCQKQDQDRIQNGISGRETQDQRKLGKFVRQGIQDFADIGYHIEFPCNLTVYHIGDTGQGHDGTGCNVLNSFLCIQIDMHIHRNQNQPEQAK